MTIVAADGPAPGSFPGQYAFLFQGLSTTVAPYASAAVGSFTADGRRHITAGIMDLITPAQFYRQIPLNGTYAVEDSGRGTLTLSGPPSPNQYMTLTTTTAQALAGVQPPLYNGALLGSLRIARQTALSAIPFAQYAVQMAGWYESSYGSYPPVPVNVSGSLTLNASAGPSALLYQTIDTSSLETNTYPFMTTPIPASTHLPALFRSTSIVPARSSATTRDLVL